MPSGYFRLLALMDAIVSRHEGSGFLTSIVKWAREGRSGTEEQAEQTLDALASVGELNAPGSSSEEVHLERNL